eukprot:gb/GFBE01067851.1/.p1 GENE.gb/GFBE01067851.1/~~gb/GFBE01067851.1/.p1  ORF type:complete len:199 (+),score=44.48 gb/GFBE01067851.1/:1-597(+)
MAFYQTLQDTVAQAEERWEETTQREKERACRDLVNQFKEECLQKAMGRHTSHCWLRPQYFADNEASFPDYLHFDERFQQDLMEAVQEALGQEFQTDQHGQPNALVRGVGSIFGHPSFSGMGITASWGSPMTVQKPSLQQEKARSNIVQNCCVCHEMANVIAMVPCGHLVCRDCSVNFPKGSACPMCREVVGGHQSLFN